MAFILRAPHEKYPDRPGPGGAGESNPQDRKRIDANQFPTSVGRLIREVAPGAHAILILDQAGWHGAKELKVPPNISLLPSPPRAPELDSQGTSGSSGAKIGCQTASSNPSTTSSTTVAALGTPSSISRGRSCPSPAAIGRPSVTHYEDWY
jgi:hypothetical protein